MKTKKNIKKRLTAICPAVVAHKLGAVDKSKAVETRYLTAVGLDSEHISTSIQLGFLKKHSIGGGGSIVIVNNLGSNKSEVLPSWKEKARIGALLEENKIALLSLDEATRARFSIPADLTNATQEEIADILRGMLPSRHSFPSEVLKRLHIMDERYVSNKYYVTEKFLTQADALAKEIEAHLSDENPNLAWKMKHMPKVLSLIRKERLVSSAKVMANSSHSVDKMLSVTTKEREQLGNEFFTVAEKVIKSIKAQGRASFTDVDTTEIVEQL